MIMESEDVNMVENHHHECINKNVERSQKVNSFSIDSLLSDNNKNSQIDNDVNHHQCSSFIDEGTLSSNLSGNVAESSEDHMNALRNSQSCPSAATFNRSFSEGKFIIYINS